MIGAGPFEILVLLAALAGAPAAGAPPAAPPPVTAPAPGTPIAELLNGAKYPLSVTLKDLGPEWRQFTLNDESGMMTTGLIAMLHLSRDAQPLPGTPRYFTRGEVVTSAGQTYLVAYHGALPTKALVAALMRSERAPLDLPTPDANAPFTLCLLSLAAAGNLRDIQPVDGPALIAEQAAIADILRGARSKALMTQSLNNLRQLTLAASMFAQNHDEVLPRADLVWASIGVEPSLLLQPGTDRRYLYNAWLSGRSLGTLALNDPSSIVAFYEPEPNAKGQRCAAFLDGHVEVLDQEGWEDAKRRSHIP